MEQAEKIKGKSYIIGTLFVTGAAIMVLEILGARIIGPYYGVSLYVWSSLITVTLIALAIGYWQGGRIADRAVNSNDSGNKEKKMKAHIETVRKATGKLYLFILLAGVSMMLIPLISAPVLKATGALGIRAGALASAFILFTLPLVFLGMVTPYAIKLLTDRLKVVGATAGNLFAISTVGSFVGTILTGFFLIPNFGAKKIIYIQAFLLISLWVVWELMNRKYMMSLVAVPFLALSVSNAVAKEKLIGADGFIVKYKAESFYGQLKVIDKLNKRWLSIDGAGHTGINMKTGLSLFPYAYYLEIMNYMRPEAKDALVVGLGGGSVTRRFRHYGLRVDSVEINEKIVDIARRFFGFDVPEEKVYIEDGRTFISSTEKRYDFVILDAFAGSDSPPVHLLTKEMFAEINNILREDGILGINTLGFDEGRGAVIPESVNRTLREVFPNIKSYRIKAEGKFGNIVFLASAGELELRREIKGCEIELLCKLFGEMLAKEVQFDEGSGTVITDDYNPLEAWSVMTSENLRKEIMAFMPAEVLLQ